MPSRVNILLGLDKRIFAGDKSLGNTGFLGSLDKVHLRLGGFVGVDSDGGDDCVHGMLLQRFDDGVNIIIVDLDLLRLFENWIFFGTLRFMSQCARGIVYEGSYTLRQDNDPIFGFLQQCLDDSLSYAAGSTGHSNRAHLSIFIRIFRGVLVGKMCVGRGMRWLDWGVVESDPCLLLTPHDKLVGPAFPLPWMMLLTLDTDTD